MSQPDHRKMMLAAAMSTSVGRAAAFRSALSFHYVAFSREKSPAHVAKRMVALSLTVTHCETFIGSSVACQMWSAEQSAGQSC
jgi:hypothetical protein